jgi:hypothetical protein
MFSAVKIEKIERRIKNGLDCRISISFPVMPDGASMYFGKDVNRSCNSDAKELEQLTGWYIKKV